MKNRSNQVGSQQVQRSHGRSQDHRMLRERIEDLPELGACDSIIRISPELDVPITRRAKELIDTRAMRRLSRISQLGLVSLVYPGATHTRLEHSLGVYRNAVLYLSRLAKQGDFQSAVTQHQGAVFLVAALMHDVGHWPFCHAIEDIRLPGLPRHELLARRLLLDSEVQTVLRSSWGIDPEEVLALLDPTAPCLANHGDSPGRGILWSMLSGPVDIDKLDYLERDSLHAGVPYGRNFDRHRLVNSLCVDSDQPRLAISEKGRTAAEMMVFARYIMFSEVYWHHAVRSATAMLQRAVFELHRNGLDWSMALDFNDAQMVAFLLDSCRDRSFAACVDGLFGERRQLYKRVAQFDSTSHPELHRAIARRPYLKLVELSNRLSQQIARAINMSVAPHDVLIDAPPEKLEVQFDLRIRGRDRIMRSLGDLSPMVRSLATHQFDDLVKRVRVLVAPKLREPLANIPVHCLLQEVLDDED